MNNSITIWPHAPPHHLSQQGTFIITCGTYRKQHVLNSPKKLSLVRNLLFKLALEYKWELQAWAVMSTHYHFVASSPEDPSSLKKMLSTLHTLSAKELNRSDGVPGRKVWHNYYDSRITYEKSWYARLKYVHQNPVHHGVVDNAELYEWCSAAWFARESAPSFYKTVQSFKIDQVKVYDDYNTTLECGKNLECGGLTPLLNPDAPTSENAVEPAHSKALHPSSKSAVTRSESEHAQDHPAHSKTSQPPSKSGVKPPHSKGNLAKLCRFVGKAVTDYKMIQEGDRLLVGISGGVDSMMLMHVLDRLQKRTPIRFELFAVNIDEGFEGLNPTPLVDYARAQDWNLKIIEVPISRLIIEKETENKPCGLCARLRRGYIHRYADEIGANKLVLGHHRDDLCVSLLMGLFRGTGLKTMSPNTTADSETKRVIRPLCYAPKALIETCAKAYEFPDLGNCDYSDQLETSGDRARLERLLKELEPDFPNLGNHMLRSMQDVRPAYLLDRTFLDLDAQL